MNGANGSKAAPKTDKNTPVPKTSTPSSISYNAMKVISKLEDMHIPFHFNYLKIYQAPSNHQNMMQE